MRNSIKWVATITVSSAKIWTRRNTETYLFRGPAWPATQHAPAQGGAITTQNIKSSLALPWNAELPGGSHLIRGVARSPHAPVATVIRCGSAPRCVKPFTLSFARLVVSYNPTRPMPDGDSQLLVERNQRIQAGL